MDSPPAEFDPEAMRRLKAINAATPGEVSHQSKIDASARFEAVESGRPLDDELGWFCLGLAYCMIKIDRSLLEVYAAAGAKLKPRTYLAPQALCLVRDAQYHNNSWSATIQGIPADQVQAFVDFVSTYIFSRKDTGEKWRLGWYSTKIGDPWSPGHVVVTHFALPVNLTKKRKFVYLSSVGSLPEFGVTRV